MEDEEEKDKNLLLKEINTNLKLLVLANKDKIEAARDSFLNSGRNKKILTLCNGKRQIKEIAKEVKMTPRAVQYAIDQLHEYGFIALKKAESGKARLPQKI